MMDYQQVIWDALVGLSGEEVLQHVTNYHGTQILDEGFKEHLIEEGVLQEESEEDEDEEEENDPNIDMEENDE